MLRKIHIYESNTNNYSLSIFRSKYSFPVLFLPGFYSIL